MNDNSNHLLVKPNHDSTEKNLKQSEIDLIKSWNSEGLSSSEIAKRLERSRATILRFFVAKKVTSIHSYKENGVKIKARHGWPWGSQMLHQMLTNTFFYVIMWNKRSSVQKMYCFVFRKINKCILLIILPLFSLSLSLSNMAGI